MILEGAQRGGADRLARHLLNTQDNDHVEIHEISGFLAGDLLGALREVEAVSRGTQCRQYFFSLSLSPPKTENVPVAVFEEAIARIEKKMGLVGQPRAIVFHEKCGPKGNRRHAHCVWSRIDVTQMRAINLPHFKLKLTECAQQIYLENNWRMPDGFVDHDACDPSNYSTVEARQAKRTKQDASALKKCFLECWAQSDSRAAFAQALKQHGLVLARGDRRGFVAVDSSGEVYAISRWVGIRAKEVRARLGKPDGLPSVDEAHVIAAGQRPNVADDAVHQAQAKFERHVEALERQMLALVASQRQARVDLQHQHQARQIEETRLRASRLPSGLKASWARLTGSYQAIVKQNAEETEQANVRDRAECQLLVVRQLKQRRALTHEVTKSRHFHELHLTALRRGDPSQSQSPSTWPFPDDSVDTSHSASPLLLKVDPAQPFVDLPDPEALTIAARVKRDPTHIVTLISDKKEIFSRSDIIRALAKYIDDPLALSRAADMALQSEDLLEVPSRTSIPKYSTRQLQNTKIDLMNRTREMAGKSGYQVGVNHINAAINRENVALQQTVGASLSAEQKAAIHHVLQPNQLSCIVGLAGTGKSTLLNAARNAWQKQGYQVVGAALSGKAANGLQAASAIESRTLASWEHSWKNGYHHLTANHVLVIDEAGMVDTRQLQRFVKEAQARGAKLVIVGDPEQLQPIQAGTPFREMVENINAAKLSEIRRQRSDWQRTASRELAEQRSGDALKAYRERGFVTETADTSLAIAKLVEDCMADIELHGANSSRLALAHRRKDVHAINQIIRSARKSSGDLSKETLVRTDFGPRAFAAGDRILFTRNDRDLGVKNGSLGTVETIGAEQLTVRLDGKEPNLITLSPQRYTAFDHGYATTIHKSQGATVDRAFVLGSTTMDRHLTYVALTRHRDDARIYGEYSALRKLSQNQTPEQAMHQPSRNQTNRRRYRRNRGPTMH